MAKKFGMDRYVEICASRNIEVKSTIDDLLLRLKDKKVQNKKYIDSISLESGTIYNNTTNNRISGSMQSPLTFHTDSGLTNKSK